MYSPASTSSFPSPYNTAPSPLINSNNNQYQQQQHQQQHQQQQQNTGPRHSSHILHPSTSNSNHNSPVTTPNYQQSQQQFQQNQRNQQQQHQSQQQQQQQHYNNNNNNNNQRSNNSNYQQQQQQNQQQRQYSQPPPIPLQHQQQQQQQEYYQQQQPQVQAVPIQSTQSQHSNPTNSKKRKSSQISITTVGEEGEEQEEEQEGNEVNEGEESKAKKKRIALSCGECKRRKIKCDRNQPCSACIRRKVPLACTWDDQDPSAPQTFALSSDLRHLARRLAQLEHQFAESSLINTSLQHPSNVRELNHISSPHSIHDTSRKPSLPISPAEVNTAHNGTVVVSPDNNSNIGPLSGNSTPFNRRSITSIPEDSQTYSHSHIQSASSHDITSSHAHHQKHTHHSHSQHNHHHQLSLSTLPPHSETEDAATSLEGTAFAARVPILRALKTLSESLPGGTTSNREVNSNPPLLESNRNNGGVETGEGVEGSVGRRESEDLGLANGNNVAGSSNSGEVGEDVKMINGNGSNSQNQSQQNPPLQSTSISKSHSQSSKQNQRLHHNSRPYPEPTSLLTSIIAEPLSFDQDGRPRSSVRLGMDLGVATSELTSRRKSAMEAIFKVLPGKEVANFLITKYFNELEWDFQVVDSAAFLVEHERYFQMVEQGRESFIDPLWIAVYCMVLALSLDGFWSRPSGDTNFSIFGGLGEKELQELPAVWHDGALRSLQLGEWGGTPRIRTIQTVILFGQYIQLSSESGQQGRFSGWAASAIRVAQRLGLHRLGHDVSIMPPDDPALPPGKNSHKREMCVRLFNSLILVDSLLSDSTSFRCYLLHPSQYSTCQPLNLNLSDFSRTDWRTIAPYPLHVHTDASFEIAQCEFASQIRRALDELVLSTKPFSYSAVLEQDREFQLVLDRLPEALSERASAPESEPPRLRYQRSLIHQGIYARIVRLHRPFLSRGYLPGSPFIYSTEQCVRSARLIINSNYELLRLTTSNWWMYTATLGSAIVLFMDLFHAIDSDTHEDEIQEKKAVLVKASFIFNTQVASPALRAVVEQGQRIILGLFVAEESRRMTSVAHTLSRSTTAMETFACVLKRISRDIASENDEASNSAHSAMLPPNTNSISPYPQAHPQHQQQQSNPNIYYPSNNNNNNMSLPSHNPYDVSLQPDFDYWDVSTGGGAGGSGGVDSPMGPDLTMFFQTLRSEDWASNMTGLEGLELEGKGGGGDGLLDQIAATW